MAVSKKWLWALTAVPVAAVAVLLLGRNRGEVDAGDEVVADRVVFVVDSLLNENRRLTDSLAVVNARLDECESARADAKKKVDCPCKDKKPAAKKPVEKKKPVAKPQPVPVQPKPQPKQDMPKPVAMQPSVKVVVKDDSQNNGAVVVGNHNTVNNVVINNYPQAVADTVKQAKRVRRVLVGYASSQHTYTK